MSQNIFEELQGKKQKLLSLARKAADFGWIPEHKSPSANPTGNKGSEAISYDEIVEKLEKDTLTIGVIGQMKCGKSTFLNSFVFENDILPAATTPMTAALSVITYGEKERIVAEFYTANEWAEQIMPASRSLDEANNALEESKIKAAKELVSKSSKLGGSLEKLLGQTQEDSFSNLIEYVGADGQYVAITKSVTIYYPKDYLRGVEIVDTPGFNDPIVSREERTKEFLRKADVVLMMLYAGRPFDATDRDIIFKNVRQCGIGKVLVGINKYDIPYCSETNPEDEEQIKNYVKAEINKACRECNDSTLIEILSEVEPIPLSAEMALLSELPMNKIASTDAFDFAWRRHCNAFGISTQAEMRQWSHLDDLVNAVKNMVNKEKDKILFAKPLNAILAVGNKLKTENDNELKRTENLISGLNKPDFENEEQEENLNKAHRRISKKINSLGDGLDSEIQNLVRTGKTELEDMVFHACESIRNVIENEWGRFKSIDSIKPRIDDILLKLMSRDLKRATETLAEVGEKKLQRNIEDFFADAEDLLLRYLPDFDSREFVKATKNKIQMEVESSDLFSIDASEEEEEDETWGEIFGECVNEFLKGATFGAWGLLTNAYNHDDVKQKALQWTYQISSNFDPMPYLESAFSKKDEAIEKIQDCFIKELIEPLQKDIQEIRENRSKKEQMKKEAEEKKDALQLKSQTITSQLEEVCNMKVGL